jgi:hypothetical protein
MDIQIEDFKKLNNSQQHVVLYNNLNNLKVCIEGYRFNQKLQYFWLGVLTLAIGGTELFKIMI